MNLALLRVLRALVALAIALTSALPVSAAPVQTPIGSIVGTVVDKASGVPLPGVSVRVVGTDRRTQTDASGHFVLEGLPVGRVVLALSRNDYQPAVSEPINLGAATLITTLSMNRGTTNLNTIAVTFDSCQRVAATVQYLHQNRQHRRARTPRCYADRRHAAHVTGRQQRHHRRYRLACRRHQLQHSRHWDARDRGGHRRPSHRLRRQGRLQLQSLSGLRLSQRDGPLRIGERSRRGQRDRRCHQLRDLGSDAVRANCRDARLGFFRSTVQPASAPPARSASSATPLRTASAT